MRSHSVSHARATRITLFLLLIVLSACSSAPQPAPAATISAAALPADWQQIEVPGASLALPPEWTTTAPDAVDLGPSIEAMTVQNPELQAVLDQGRAALAAGQVQLIAYDLAPERFQTANFPTNLRIGRQSYPDAPDPQNVADVNEADLRATAGFSEIVRTPVAIGDTAATRLTSTLLINDLAGEPLRLAIEQYIVVIERDVYVLTFTTPREQAADYRALFDQILATLRFTPA